MSGEDAPMAFDTPRTSPSDSDHSHPLAWPGVTHWETMFAVGLHLTILLYHALLPVVPALALWWWRRKRSKFIDDHGRQAINFQIALLLYAGVGLLLSPVTCGAAPYVIWPCVYILGAVGMVRACIAAKHGRVFRYPMSIAILPAKV